MLGNGFLFCCNSVFLFVLHCVFCYTLDFFATLRFFLYCYPLPYPSVIWTNLCLSAPLWTTSSFADILQISPSKVGILAKVAGCLNPIKGQRVLCSLLYSAQQIHCRGCCLQHPAGRQASFDNGCEGLKPTKGQRVLCFCLHSLPFCVLKSLRYLRQNSDLGRIILQTVLVVANVSAEMRASLTKTDSQKIVRSHGGIGEG